MICLRNTIRYWPERCKCNVIFESALRMHYFHDHIGRISSREKIAKSRWFIVVSPVSMILVSPCYAVRSETVEQDRSAERQLAEIESDLRAWVVPLCCTNRQLPRFIKVWHCRPNDLLIIHISVLCGSRSVERCHCRKRTKARGGRTPHANWEEGSNYLIMAIFLTFQMDINHQTSYIVLQCWGAVVQALERNKWGRGVLYVL